MSDDYLIRHCAPTLAGIKTGSLFPCPYETREALLCAIRQTNKRLSAKGLRIIPLRFSEKKALLYLFRPKCLSRDLLDETARKLLLGQGYEPERCEKCVARLAKRVQGQADFPHEIGLFLGYPPEDVGGFMENRACKCVGCWKVYGDVESARKKFAQYEKCTRVYCDRWAKGTKIERLAVASR